MLTHSLTSLSQARTLSLPFAFRARSKPAHNSPFVEALKHIGYGRLTMMTPDGKILEFTGKESGPVAHMHIYDWGVLDEIIGRGEMGLAFAYIDERWDSKDLSALLTFGLVNSPSLEKFFHGRPLYAIWTRLKHVLSANSLRGSRRNIMTHYDLGNDFYKLWLDDSMTYSCALFEGDMSRSLEDAQQAKYHRILRKLGAVPGDHILEIGCGWGGFAEAAAKQGIKVTGITISEKQGNYARDRLHQAGLSHLASIQMIDYREMIGTFDHVVSIGMFEHVGEEYWATYFDMIKKQLKPGGKAMVQSITLDDRLFEDLHGYSGFIEQVIFPGGMLPSKARFRAVAQKAGLECRELYAFGQDYARTTRYWLSRFEARAWEVKALGYDEAFMRLWRFYLSCCIASFTSHRTDVMQSELTHVAA